MQKPLSNNMHTLNFNATSNIQHYSHTSAAEQVQLPVANFYETPYASNCHNIQQGVQSFNSSATDLQYVVQPQNMPVNEKVGFANSSYPASYSQPSYDAQYVNRVEVASGNSAPYTHANNHDSASSVPSNYSRINENSASTYGPSQANSAYVLSHAQSQSFASTSQQKVTSNAWDAEFASLKAYVAKMFETHGKEITALMLECKELEKNNNSDLSKSSVITTTERYLSVQSKETSLVVEDHANHKKTTTFHFPEAEGVVHLYLPSDIRVINKRQVQAKESLISNDNVESKKEVLACRDLVISGNTGNTGLTDLVCRFNRPLQEAAVVGCHQQKKYNTIYIKVPRLSNIFSKH